MATEVTRQTAWGRAVTLAGASLAAALLVLACSNGTGEGYVPVRLTVTDASGISPTGFVAVATFSDGQTRVQACGDLAVEAAQDRAEAKGIAGASDNGSPAGGTAGHAASGGTKGNEAGDADSGVDVSDNSDRIRCAEKGMELNLAFGDIHVAVKARGFRTSTIDIPEDEEAGSVPLTLPAAPAAELNEDYATAITPEDAEKVFAALGVEVDTELGPALALKFYIENIQGSPIAYFQNSHRYPLHYDFVYQVLGHKIPRSQFDDETYEGPDRNGMAGTIVWYPYLTCPSEDLGGTLVSPLTLNFFPSDDLTPEQVLHAHRVLEDQMPFVSLTGGKSRLVYLPAGSFQEADLAGAKSLFQAQDTLWIARPELYGDLTMQLLNPGIAYGTLRLMTPEELATTPVSFTDILVLTRLPNDLPIVGGTITEELQTPLAHVNIAARTRGTPNLAMLDASKDPRIAPFFGKLVRFEVAGGTFTLEETTIDAAEAYWESIKKEPMVPTGDLGRTDLPDFSQFGFSDASAFGVKAANLAEMATVLPNNTPDGFAVPFYYYDRFMKQARLTPELCDAAKKDCTSEGRPEEVCAAARKLCQPPENDAEPPSDGEPLYYTVDRFLADAAFKSDTALREAALDALRYAMRNTPIDPDFAPVLDARVTELFGEVKVRLRSSTNCEDLPDFSGAGLYTSTGAWASGPQAASLEIRKVWASVWNFKAFEERSFWNIDHRAVRMGVLVSTAYTDEQANGVLITRNVADATSYGMYVNVQVGEEPVTNPEGGAMPEIVTLLPAPGWDGVQVNRQRFSSLSPDEPILTMAEMWKLYVSAYKVMTHFGKLYGEDPYEFPFDIEFKLAGPDRKLIFKQVRPYSVAGE